MRSGPGFQDEGYFAFAASDWRFYAEKLRKLRCDIDEASIKPYFQLDRIVEAAFYTANRLFGLTSNAATGSRSGTRTCGCRRW